MNYDTALIKPTAPPTFVSSASTDYETYQSDNPAIITVRDLRLTRGDFSLVVEKLIVGAGERVAMVGRNGSGKSLLLETLLGLRHPQTGQITLLGNSPDAFKSKPGLKHDIGALLQDVQFESNILIVEIVRMHRSLYRRVNPVILCLLGIDELLDRPYKALSRGQKQRVQLYLALAHEPSLVLLDEPTLGLDEAYAKALRDYWQAAAGAGRTLLMISHVPADLEKMDRLVCMAGGRVVDSGSLDTLINRHLGRYCGRILLPLSADLQKELETIAGIVHVIYGDHGDITLYGHGAFESDFRLFLMRQQITAFSLEPTGPGDLLAFLAGV